MILDAAWRAATEGIDIDFVATFGMVDIGNTNLRYNSYWREQPHPDMFTKWYIDHCGRLVGRGANYDELFFVPYSNGVYNKPSNVQMMLNFYSEFYKQSDPRVSPGDVGFLETQHIKGAINLEIKGKIHTEIDNPRPPHMGWIMTELLMHGIH